MRPMRVVSESSVGIWAWIVLIVAVNVLWVSMDLWLYKSGHEMLTDEFREGIRSRVWGPVLAFLLAGTVAAFVWHMFFTPTRPGVH